MSEAVGQTHYKYQPAMDDVELFEKGYNRVYDTLEMELNLNHVEEVAAATLNRLDPNEPLSSEILNRGTGAHAWPNTIPVRASSKAPSCKGSRSTFPRSRIPNWASIRPFGP